MASGFQVRRITTRSRCGGEQALHIHFFIYLNNPSITDIGDDCPSPNDITDFFFPIAHAGVTKCSTYAVVCRLKSSPPYTITSAGGCVSHPDFPGVTVTIPENAVAPKAKFPLKLQVGVITSSPI